MDGLHAILGTGAEITVSGETLRLRFDGGWLNVLAEVERRVIDGRKHPLAGLMAEVAECDDATQERVLRLGMELGARAPRATNAEVAEYITSPRGVAFLLWCATRAEHAAMDEAACLGLVERVMQSQELPQLMDALSAAAGMVLPKKKTTGAGRSARRGFAGAKSSADSHESTDSARSKSAG